MGGFFEGIIPSFECKGKSSTSTECLKESTQRELRKQVLGFLREEESKPCPVWACFILIKFTATTFRDVLWNIL